MNIKLIGTNHLMKKEDVEELIRKENPDIIGVELCEARQTGILNEVTKETIENKDNNNLLDKITNKIKQKAKAEGLDYGSDMKAALMYSLNNKKETVLVDMPISKIQELFSKIPEQEALGFASELKEFEGESITKEVSEEEVLLGMKSRYPIAFEFLINMRNLYIANQILITQRENPNKKIVVILGSSHVENVNKLIGEKQ